MSQRRTKVFKVDELISDETFQNYCLGTNSKDVKQWEDIIFTHWSQQATFKEAHDTVIALADVRVFNRTQADAKVVSLQTIHWSDRAWLKPLAIVASVLMLVLAGWGITSTSTDNQVLITHNTGISETKQFDLPDGSSVTLNGNSSISYLSDMENHRNVSFTGEVFFEVLTTADTKNFSVSGDYGKLTVTGTKFNLKLRQSIFEATLIEGAITYQRDNIGEIFLRPGDQLTYFENEIKIEKVELPTTTDWLVGRMIFKDVLMKDLISELQRDYGLDVIIQKAGLNDKKISANMLTSDPEELLNSIGFIYNFKVEKEGDQLILK